MPKFQKSTGYKMKGPTFFNKNESPLKVSDQSVVDAQAKLDEVQLKFREPGWTHVARGVHEGAKSVLGKFMGGEKGKEGGSKEKIKKSGENVQEIASQKFLKEDYKLGDLGSSTSLAG